MRCINKVILIGNLTRDPELRSTPSGQMVATFGLATNREWTTKEGERKSSAEFHECVAWGKLAEICSNFLNKGQLVYIEGYLKTRSWESQEGVKKFKTEIVIKDMIRLEKGSGKAQAEDMGQNEEDDYMEDYEDDDENTSTEETTTNEDTEEVQEEQSQEPAVEEPTQAEETDEDDTDSSSIIDKDLGL